MVHEELKQGYR